METATTVTIDGYARAVLQVFRAEGEVDALVDAFYQAAHALDERVELREALTDPRLPVERKLAVLEDLLAGRLARPVVAGLGLVVAAGHGKHLVEVASRLAELVAEEEGAAVAEVRSAVELTEDQIERLRAALARATGREVEVKVVVDPALIGGVVAKIGDTVFDGSVKSQLDELREQWG